MAMSVPYGPIIWQRSSESQPRPASSALRISGQDDTIVVDAAVRQTIELERTTRRVDHRIACLHDAAIDPVSCFGQSRSTFKKLLQGVLPNGNVQRCSVRR